MGFGLWFREYTVRTRASTHETWRNSRTASLPLDAAAADPHRHGFDDVLSSVAVAFDVWAPSSFGPHVRGLAPRAQVEPGRESRAGSSRIGPGSTDGRRQVQL